jgi:hypothetical protein
MVKKDLYLIPLLILILSLFYSIYIVYTSDIILGIKHFLGFIFLGISVVAVFLNKGLCVYFTGVTLLVGTFNIVAFTPSVEVYSFGFGFNNTTTNSFKIQLFSFLILILYFLINGKYLLKKIKEDIKYK